MLADCKDFWILAYTRLISERTQGALSMILQFWLNNKSDIHHIGFKSQPCRTIDAKSTILTATR